jgi:hypothetical protein
MIPRLIQLAPAAAVTGIVMLLACSTTTDSCACSPPLTSAAVKGVVLTSDQQPAAAAIVAFAGATDPTCTPNQLPEPLYIPGLGSAVVTDQVGQFVTELRATSTGSRCVWIVARANAAATDSTLGTVLADFQVTSVPDTVSVSLTLPDSP